MFDIRSIIALLLGIYSLVLVGLGAFDHSAIADLWTGLGLAVAAAVFTVWAVRKPVAVARINEDKNSAI